MSKAHGVVRQGPVGGGCIIIDVFGEYSWVTKSCRSIRDKILRPTSLGRAIISLYYRRAKTVPSRGRG